MPHYGQSVDSLDTHSIRSVEIDRSIESAT